METKKISFGFSKTSTKPSLLLKNPPDGRSNKIELIKCLEGQSIKLVVEKPDSKPSELVIPLKNSSKTSAALASLQARRAIIEGEEIKSNELDSEPPPDIPAIDPTEETIEKRAARELLEELTKNTNLDSDANKLTLPIVSADELPLDGAKESTLDDYNSIPVQQFGKAMLRGMGWKDMPKKKNDINDIEDGPVQRPKGMGLGADKAIKRHVALIPPSASEVLEIKKKAFVRILGGKHKDMYGQVDGFDDYAGRIIVKFALGGNTDSVNEFMVQPVSKKEYQEYGKVINSAKYDEYKKLENESGQIIIKKEEISKLERSEMKTNQEIKLEFQPTDIKVEKLSISDVKYDHKKSHKVHVKKEKHDRSRSRDRSTRESRQIEKNRSQSSDSGRTDDSRSPAKHHKSKKKSSKKTKKSRNRSRSPQSQRNHKKKSKKNRKDRSRSRTPRK